MKPTYFHSKLTGSGKKVGFFNAGLSDPENPVYTAEDNYFKKLLRLARPKVVPVKKYAKLNRATGTLRVLNLTSLPIANYTEPELLRPAFDHLKDLLGVSVIPMLVAVHEPTSVPGGVLYLAEVDGQLTYSTTPYVGGVSGYDNYTVVSRLAAYHDEKAHELIEVMLESDLSDDIKQTLVSNLHHSQLSFYDNAHLFNQLKNFDLDVEGDNHLMMLNAVEKLSTVKNELPRLEDNSAPAPDWLTPAQQDAVKTTEPLVLVQAGAGTGKSTTIASRIDYMLNSGIAPESIRVLSLTNAAADNITAKAPQVASSTIATYLHQIYQENLPGHVLVNEQTLIKTIRLKAPRDPMAPILIDICQSIIDRADSNHNPTQLLIKNSDGVVRLLNTLGMVTLALESYIVYASRHNWYFPEVYDHYIVDETQDNNVFEFITIMTLAAEQKASLYIVGDPSQTLYEFRGASSLALNAIESNGCFETITLDVNYRSNQAVLDLANVVLNHIDVNRYANIQLKSGVEGAAPENPVVLEDILGFNANELDSNQVRAIIKSTKDFIDSSLENGEKLAVLTNTNQLQKTALEVFEELYADKRIAQLNTQSTYVSHLISDFWLFNKEPLSVSTNLTIQSIVKRMLDAATNMELSRFNAYSAMHRLLSRWHRFNGAHLRDLSNRRRDKSITTAQWLDGVIESMVDFEVAENNWQQSILDKGEDKSLIIKDNDVIFSTVHSAKGMEFDHVLYLNTETGNADQAKLRMLYVALTRAQKREHIINIRANGRSDLNRMAPGYYKEVESET